MSLRLAKPVYELVDAHAAKSYPRECCGALIGRVPADFDRAGRCVEAADCRAFGNAWEEAGRATRYAVDPGALARLERELLGTGRGIIGWYHTHPDVPAWPSPFDLSRAWPCYSYLILSVAGGKTLAARSWMRSEDGKDFIAEALEIA